MSNNIRTSFVVFEGLDGTGKSTAARRTAEMLGARYMTTPSPAVRSFRDQLITSFGGCQEACQLFYLATVFGVSQEIRGLLKQRTSVVLDRYFLSTQAYAAFRGSALDLDDLGMLLLPADLTVFLRAPLEVRYARVAARGASIADHETLQPQAEAILLDLHRARMGSQVIGRLLEIDTSRNSPGDVARRVVAELVSRRR